MSGLKSAKRGRQLRSDASRATRSATAKTTMGSARITSLPQHIVVSRVRTGLHGGCPAID